MGLYGTGDGVLADEADEAEESRRVRGGVLRSPADDDDAHPMSF